MPADQSPAQRPTQRIELLIERIVVGSRWLQVPLYIGLIFVLAVVVVKFPFKIWDLVSRVLTAEESDLVLAVLLDRTMAGKKTANGH